MSQVCPHTAPYNDASDLWQSLLVGLTELDQSVSLHNQDLAGFFVSILLNRFLEAARLLLYKAYDFSDSDLHDVLRGIFMTVDMTNSTAPIGLFRGRYCSPAPKVYSIRMDLFLKAVELSFKFSLFSVGNQVVQQSRGAPMRSPFSPSVCHAVISLFEHQYFSRMLLSAISSSSQAWVGRYVDHRLTLLSPVLAKLPLFAAVLHEEVYGPPVLLEYEDGDIFLGFHVDLPRMARALHVCVDLLPLRHLLLVHNPPCLGEVAILDVGPHLANFLVTVWTCMSPAQLDKRLVLCVHLLDRLYLSMFPHILKIMPSTRLS